MEPAAIPYQRIVFVCTNERTSGPRVSCGGRGGIELRQRLKELVKEHGLADRIRISSSGCMDVCEEGPNLMQFPDNRWICDASPDDAEALFEEIRAGIG
jgi:(2Fe-2S) ferredoxin